MELINYLKSNNLVSFESVKENMALNNLHVKDDTSSSTNLYMIYYSFGQDLPQAWMRQCRGIILEKETNRIVCYTFDKNYDSITELEPNYNRIEELIDGTQIRLFFYNGEWRCATTRCIDAKKAYWFSDKSFFDMFGEAATAIGFDLNKLDKACCYAFVLCHPENRIVVKYEKPALYHVLTRNMNTLQETECDIGVAKPRRYDSLPASGIAIIVDRNGRRMKVQDDKYKLMKELRGNGNNLFFRYLELRKDGLVDQFLEYYPEYEKKIEEYQREFANMTSEIYKLYVSKHITHGITDETPKHMKHILYMLHGNYLRTGRKITYVNVAEELNELDVKLVCHMFNKTFGCHYRED